MAQTAGGKAGRVAAIVLGGAGVAVLVYELTRPAPGAASTTAGNTEPGVVFAGIEGSVQVADGAALPALQTAITNQDTASHSYSVSATSGPIAWTPDAATFTLAGGASRTVNWSAVYQGSDGAGPFTTTLEIGVDTMPTQTFPDPTPFSVQVTAPPAAQASITFPESPSGSYSIQYGQTLTLNVPGTDALETKLTNTGGSQGVFTVTAAVDGPAPGPWYAFNVVDEQTGTSSAISTPTPNPSPITLDPGQSVIIFWGIGFAATDATLAATQTSLDGTYTTTVTVSW